MLFSSITRTRDHTGRSLSIAVSRITRDPID
jgi:hypothetical protein